MCLTSELGSWPLGGPDASVPRARAPRLAWWMLPDMFRIRKEQMQAFEKAVEKNVECSLYGHINRIWPQRCRKMGEEMVRQWIRQTVQKAGKYGIQDEYDLSRYMDLTFMLGADFDTSGDTPWAGQVLADPDLSAGTKLDRLCRLAEGHLRGAPLQGLPKDS